MKNIEEFGPRKSIGSRTEYDILKADVERLEKTFAEVASQHRGAPGVPGNPNPSPKLEADIKRYRDLLDQYESENADEFKSEPI